MTGREEQKREAAQKLHEAAQLLQAYGADQAVVLAVSDTADAIMKSIT